MPLPIRIAWRARRDLNPRPFPERDRVGSSFRLRASASLSLLLYLAEPPDRSLRIRFTGPSDPPKSPEVRNSYKRLFTMKRPPNQESTPRGFPFYMYLAQMSPGNTILPLCEIVLVSVHWSGQSSLGADETTNDNPASSSSVSCSYGNNSRCSCCLLCFDN